MVGEIALLDGRGLQGGGAEVQLSQVVAWLERLAPLDLAEDWDNVGLLLGRPEGPVTRVMTCLTLTPDVAEEAVAAEAELIVSHHPLMFKPIQRLSGATDESRVMLALLRAGVAVYSPHTAFDSAPRGINQQLAELLELTEITPLRPRRESQSVKVVTFVPEAARTALLEALWAAGAGHVGEYNACSFYHEGTGTFRGSLQTHPAVGQAGRLETVAESRVELLVARGRLPLVLATLRAKHPYEEPAIDVYATEPMLEQTRGAGRGGQLARAMTLGELADLVAVRLKLDAVQVVGSAEMLVDRVGIGCGAAGDFWVDAARQGCQAFLTGEARFHTCAGAREAGCGLLVAGHYATERPAVEQLAREMAIEFPAVECWASRCERDPLTWRAGTR